MKISEQQFLAKIFLEKDSSNSFLRTRYHPLFTTVGRWWEHGGCPSWKVQIRPFYLTRDGSVTRLSGCTTVSRLQSFFRRSPPYALVEPGIRKSSTIPGLLRAVFANPGISYFFTQEMMSTHMENIW